MRTNVAVRKPAAVGIKETGTLQDVPTAKMAGQLLVIEKSPGFAPDSAIEVIETGWVPVLVIATVWGLLPIPTVWPLKANEIGETPMLGAGWPVPVSDTVRGELVALLVMDKTAVRAPKAPGVKTSEIVQECEAAKVLRQVDVGVKSAAFAPVRPML